jgi:preprotein translocase subunit SecG
MINIFITLFTFVLILVSLFLVLVVLMQRANTNAGMGSAFGGGVAESAFGADTANVLTRLTKWAAVAFFLISLLLYLLYIGRTAAREDEGVLLPVIPGETTTQELPAAPAEPVPAEPVP